MANDTQAPIYSRWWLILPSLLLATTPDSAIARDYVISTIALVGDPILVAGQQATYTGFSGPAIVNNLGDVTLRVSVQCSGNCSPGSSSNPQGVALIPSTGPDTLVAWDGMPAPGTGGAPLGMNGVFPTISDGRSVLVFAAFGPPEQSFNGIFAFADGVLAPIVLPGDPVPGVTGETFLRFTAATMSPTASIAFNGLFACPDPPWPFWQCTQGTFLLDDSEELMLAMEGDPLPGFEGEILESAGPNPVNSLNANGELAARVFSLNDDQTSSIRGIYVLTDGPEYLRSAVGDVVPRTGGDVITNFLNNGPMINTLGDLAFKVRTASSGDAILLQSAGVTQTVALTDEEAPGTGGATFNHDFGEPWVGERGEVTFWDRFWGGAADGMGVFLYENGSIQPVVLPNRMTVEGVTIIRPLNSGNINRWGAIAFVGESSAGLGLFLATPVRSTPSSSRLTLGLLAFGVGASGLYWIRRLRISISPSCAL